MTQLLYAACRSWDVNVLSARLLAVFPRQGSKAEAQIQAAQELMPGQRSPAFTLSFVNLITSDVTVTLTFPDVAWLRQYSGDAVVVVEGGDIANVEVQFTHVVVRCGCADSARCAVLTPTASTAQNETSPLALGEHTASITLNVTAGSGSFELWYADTTFKAAAGFVAASQCIVRFGDDAQQSAVPSDLRYCWPCPRAAMGCRSTSMCLFAGWGRHWQLPCSCVTSWATQLKQRTQARCGRQTWLPRCRLRHRDTPSLRRLSPSPSWPLVKTAMPSRCI